VRYSQQEQIIRYCVRSRKAYAACDGSEKVWQYGGHYAISYDQNEIIIERTIGSNQWDCNNTKTTEGYVLLELMEQIRILCENIESGLITVYLDNNYLLKKVTTVDKKVSISAEDCGTICSRIDKILNSILADFVFEYGSSKTRSGKSFEDNRGGYLVRYCDKKSKERRKDTERIDDNVVNIRKCVMLVNGIPCDRNMREIVHEIDAYNSSEDMVAQIFKDNWQLVDLKSRKVFMSRAMMGVIKCAIGYNHYGHRYSVINKNLTMSKCPRCDKCKTWEHVIQCEAICCKNKAFMISL